MNIIKVAYPERLTMARDLRMVSQAELAVMTDIPHESISKYENAVKAIPEKDVTKFAKSLRFPIKFFYEPMVRYPILGFIDSVEYGED